MTIAERNEPVDRNIRRVIKGKCLKKGLVAKKAGYTSQEFSDMLHGRKLIRVYDIVNIADVLGVTTAELMKMEIER